MEVHHQQDQRYVDRRQTASEPARQEDVSDRTIVGTERLGHIGERTAEPVRREDQALATHHRSGERARRSDRFAKPAYSR